MASASPPRSSPMLPILAAVLTVATTYLVYDPTRIGLDPSNGLYVLWVSAPLGMIIVYMMTVAKPGRWDDALARFARLEHEETVTVDSGSSSYRAAPERRKTRTGGPLLKKVTAVPADLTALLELSADGTPVAFFEIHPKVAYVAITEANAMNASDCTTVLMKLEEGAPTFEARPLVPIDPLPQDAVSFTKDPKFSEKYVVQGADAKKVRSFLSEPIRAELCDSPATWVEAEKRALAVSIYGDFDSDRAYRLVETADVFFAEYGADGGQTLLEPSGAPKKKKKKKPDAPAGDPAESPA